MRVSSFELYRAVIACARVSIRTTISSSSFPDPRLESININHHWRRASITINRAYVWKRNDLPQRGYCCGCAASSRVPRLSTFQPYVEYTHCSAFVRAISPRKLRDGR
ncbi:hypothetical protein AB1N83_006091 [Pleurotus pulmonarius]